MNMYKLFILALMLVPISLALTNTANPTLSVGQMAINPSSASVNVLENFPVIVKAKVSDSAAATAVKFKITYNPAQLEVVSTNVLLPADWTVGNGFSTTTSGTITFQKSYLMGGTPVNGEFNIGTITFKAKVAGTSYIVISNDFSTDTKVLKGATNHINSVGGAIITITSAPAAICGNNQIEAGENCDDGNTVTETACAYGQQACTACNNACTTSLSLTGFYCGDGIANNAEQCDDGPSNTNTCTATPGNSCTYCDTNCRTQTVTAAPALIGDLNSDGQVNMADVYVALARWGTADADLNGDGTTNIHDVFIILKNWS